MTKTNNNNTSATTISAEANTVLEAQRRSVVPLTWQRAYQKHEDKAMRGTCGDTVAAKLREYTTVGGKLHVGRLQAVGLANGFDPLVRWAGKNEGMLRMNTSNVLRGMAKRGEAVQWPDDAVAKPATKARKAKAKA